MNRATLRAGSMEYHLDGGEEGDELGKQVGMILQHDHDIEVGDCQIIGVTFVDPEGKKIEVDFDPGGRPIQSFSLKPL